MYAPKELGSQNVLCYKHLLLRSELITRFNQNSVNFPARPSTDRICRSRDCRGPARRSDANLSATVPRSQNSKRCRRQYGPGTRARSARLPFRISPRPRRTHPDQSLYARTLVGPGTVPTPTRRPLRNRIRPNSHRATNERAGKRSSPRSRSDRAHRRASWRVVLRVDRRVRLWK